MRRYQNQTPEPSPDELKSLKDFIGGVAYSIDGEGCPRFRTALERLKSTLAMRASRATGFAG